MIESSHLVGTKTPDCYTSIILHRDQCQQTLAALVLRCANGRHILHAWRVSFEALCQIAKGSSIRQVVSFLRKQESMLDSPHASLDSRLRGNDMNSYANLCNQALVSSEIGPRRDPPH